MSGFKKMRIKSEWKVSKYLIAGLILSAVISISYVMIGSMASCTDGYCNTGIVDSGFEGKYSKFNNQTENIAQMWNATSSKGGFSLLNAADVVIQSSVSVASLIFGSVTNLKNQISSTASDFGIPQQIFTILSVLLIVVIVILIIMAIINFFNKTGGI